MVLTTTAAFGSAMYFDAACSSCTRSWSGDRPAATTSFSNGREIFPSGRTTTSADISLSRQNTTANTSSAPITYPAGSAADGGRFAGGTGGFAGAVGAGGGVWALGVWAPAAAPNATTHANVATNAKPRRNRAA